MRIRQIKDIRRLFTPTSKRKMSKQKKRGLILTLSTLLFVGGIWGQAEDVSANAPDSYIRQQLTNAFNNNSTTYTYRGYFSIHGGASNTIHRWGRFDDPRPNITVQNSLYHPRRFNYRSYPFIEMYSPLANWGFVPGIVAQWDGGMYSVASGVGAGWQRSARVDYTRHKTVPETRGVTISGYDHVNGNEYWVRQGNSVQARVHGRQDFNGTRWRWNDYVTINFMRMTGSSTVQGNMNHNGVYSNDRAHAHLTISRNGFSRTTDHRDLFTTFNVRGNTHGTRHQFNTYARSANGRNHGYVASGKFLNVDGVVPTDHGATVFNARYVNGNDHWIRPGDNIVVEAQGYDRDSRMRQSNIRLFSNGHDNRARHFWTLGQGTDQYQRTGDTTTFTGGRVDNWGWTTRYHFNVSVNSNAGNRTINIETLHGDNVGHGTGWTTSNQRIRTDATAPTISANPASSAWGNSNVTVALTHADAESGIATRQFAWSTSTVTPTNWTNYSGPVTQSTQGTWYLHARAVDNVGRVTTERFGPYRIDNTAPDGTITGNPTSWTNQNATLTFNATDTGGSGVRRVRIAGGTWVNGATTTQIATENGTYSFEVEDHAGNTRTVSATVNRIDKAVPNGTITGNPTAWQNTNATLTFNATDTGGSGVRRVRIAGGTWVDGATTTQIATENGTYSFEVEDHAGNTSTRSHTVTNIDKILPNASSTQSPTAWTNGNVDITWNASATGSPLSRIRTHNGSTWGAWSAVSGTTSSTVQTVTSNGIVLRK